MTPELEGLMNHIVLTLESPKEEVLCGGCGRTIMISKGEDAVCRECKMRDHDEVSWELRGYDES